MTKVAKVLLTLVMACIMLVVGTTSALAFNDTNLMACWSNCGTGGNVTN